jgi:hypothetical protein
MNDGSSIPTWITLSDDHLNLYASNSISGSYGMIVFVLISSDIIKYNITLHCLPKQPPLDQSLQIASILLNTGPPVFE